jgi:hypothetical protein
MAFLFLNSEVLSMLGNTVSFLGTKFRQNEKNKNQKPNISVSTFSFNWKKFIKYRGKKTWNFFYKKNHIWTPI